MKLLSPNRIVYLSLFCGLLSCKTDVVEKGHQEIKDKSQAKQVHVVSDTTKVIHADAAEVKNSETYSNGVKISWLKRGNGESLKKGDVVAIDYKVTLDNGDVVDGNHLLNRKAIPFMIGFKMQTEGWDFAFSKLKVGDYVRIFLPSRLARGEKGIKGLIPPNADNYITLHVLKKELPEREIDGVKVWLFDSNPSNTVRYTKSNGIEFHYMISSESNPIYYNSFRENKTFTLHNDDIGVIPGLKKALLSSKKADRMFIYVPSKEGFGSKGNNDLVKSNEDLFYNVLVMEIVK
jgi:FKBP-type peptidyl-prolyl cis-trans isomerase